jgi:chemotaxis protein methyltransferase CheR/two-component system CheB/CheR fusion protein
MPYAYSTKKKYVVGIGASAGGLEAVKLLLANVKKTGRFVFVIAQHMATDSHMLLMEKLIGVESVLPVSIVNNGEVLQVDHVYLIPAACDGYVDGDKFHLQPLSGHTYSKPSVNVLFNSIAKQFGANAIGIILSGAGTDGAAGCLAIKASGGMTLAQDPETAQFNGMPVAAIGAGVIEYVAAPENMGALLIAKLHGTPISNTQNFKSPLSVSTKQLDELIDLVLRNTGLTFSQYKEETLLRRIKARLVYLKMRSTDAYIEYCKAHPEEFASLKQMFLVTMSSFYRDKACFDALAGYVRQLVEKRPVTEPFRVLVPACAAGEECYSLAIMMAEIFKQKPTLFKLQIIGSDLNPHSIDNARLGWYPEKSFKEMDVQLIDKYFTREGEGYRISQQLKDVCSFRQSDVFEIADSVKYDLISCRNLLIYFKTELQELLIQKFYRQLKPDGLLFLGQSENVGIAGAQYFFPVDYHHRIYRRKTS